MSKVKNIKLVTALTVAAVACCGVFAGADVSAMAKIPAISKSKTASELVKGADEIYRSNIKLSMPADETPLESDVVFVLDKSTSASVEDQALQMLKDLQRQVKDTNATVKVGVVIFNKQAHSTEQYLDLVTDYSKIEQAIKQEIKSGTNSHAGLLAAKDLLAKGKATNSRKYMIFVSDGITYMFGKEPTSVAWSFDADGVKNWAGPDNYSSKYGNNKARTTAEWDAFFAGFKAADMNDTTYDYPYGGTPTVATDVKDQATAINSIDKALYLTRATYNEICADINCYAVNEENKSVDHPWGPSFMDYLADGKEVEFNDIKNDIIYLVDKGSVVTDVMGSGIDNLGAEYNFDFDINGEFYLSVGETQYKAVKIAENKYGFGSPRTVIDELTTGYPYVLTYYPESETVADDYFVLNINVPVKISEPLALNYSVILTNPSDIVGVHGQYDKDGSAGHAEEGGLSTNNKADLDYVSTDKTTGKEEFKRPTVSYEVKGGMGGETEEPEVPETPVEKPVVPAPVEPEIENPNTNDEAGINVAKFAAFILGLALSAGYLSFEAIAFMAAKNGIAMTADPKVVAESKKDEE